MVAEFVDDIYTIKKVLSDAKERALRHHFTISFLKPKSYFLYQPWLKPREYAKKINYEQCDSN